MATAQQRSLVLNPIPPRGLVESDYIPCYPTDSTVNDYIPLQSVPTGELVTYKTGESVFLYTLDAPGESSYLSIRKFEDFCKNMFSASRWGKLVSRGTFNSPFQYYCMNGMLLAIQEHPFVVKPLIVMSIKKSKLSETRGVSNLRNLCLIISKDLVNEEAHSSVYRSMKKFYLDEVDKEIDTYFAKDLMQLCYNSGNIKMPKLKTIDAMLNYLSHINLEVAKSL